MTWLPSGELLFQLRGNRNYVVFDPLTKTERPLLDDDAVVGLPGSGLKTSRSPIAFTTPPTASVVERSGSLAATRIGLRLLVQAGRSAHR